MNKPNYILYFLIFFLLLILNSIQESQQPQRNKISFTHLGVIPHVFDIGQIALLADGLGICNPEFHLAIYEVVVVTTTSIDLVVFPQHIHEKGLHRLLAVNLYGIDGVEQVGIVKHHFRRLLREILTKRINQIQQACVGEILDVVHHGSTAGLDVVSQLAHIRRLLRAVFGNLVEELLDLRQILQLYLLDKQDIHLGHHVHRLQEVLAVVAVLLEEWIESVVDIVLKIAIGRHLRQDLAGNVLVIVENFLKRIGAEIVTRQQIDELAEGEASEVVRLDDAVEFRVLVFESHHTRACKDNFQVRVEIVTLAQLRTPVWLFEYLVDQQDPSAMMIEVACEIGYTTSLEIEIVHVDVETLSVLCVEVSLGVLKEEGGFAHATRTFYTYHAIAPVNLIHKGAMYWCIDMLHKVSVRPEKSLHLRLICLVTL